MRIVIVGKAASGKTFMKNKMSSLGCTPSKSHTTRPNRTNNRDKEFYFVTENEFKNLIDINCFQEYVKHGDHLYGITKAEWNTKEIFIKTPDGVAQISPEDRKNTIIYYLDIPSEILKQRLEERSWSFVRIQERLLEDEMKFQNFTDYDFHITNPKF